MGNEIERKFLMADDSWRGEVTDSSACRQGYIRADNLTTVRVRIKDGKGFLTIKSAVKGISRREFEYQIPPVDAQQMLDELCARPQIEKIRHFVNLGTHTAEIDEFLGENAGLTVCEIELRSPEEPFEHPCWLGPEVSGIPDYFNSNLAAHPFCTWKDGTPPLRGEQEGKGLMPGSSESMLLPAFSERKIAFAGMKT